MLQDIIFESWHTSIRFAITEGFISDCDSLSQKCHLFNQIPLKIFLISSELLSFDKDTDIVGWAMPTKYYD